MKRHDRRQRENQYERRNRKRKFKKIKEGGGGIEANSKK